MCVCFVHAAMTDLLRSCVLHVLFGYEWVYRADIEIEKVFFVNRVSFRRKKDIWDNHDLNEWTVKEDVCLAYLWGLQSSLRFLRVERIFMQNTNVFFDWLFRQLPLHLSWWYFLIIFSKTAMQRAIASAISQTAEQWIKWLRMHGSGHVDYYIDNGPIDK